MNIKLQNKTLVMAEFKLFVKFHRFSSMINYLVRRSSTAADSMAEMCGDVTAKRGLVIGAFDNGLGGCQEDVTLTKAGRKFDASVEGKITELLRGLTVRSGVVHTFTNISAKYAEVAVVGVGRRGINQYNELENIDEVKENIRVAAGVGSRILQRHGMEEIIVESFDDTEAAAEGSHLAIWQYQDNKNDDDKQNESKIDLLEGDREKWDRGVTKAEAQNVARCLCEIPGNLLTPTLFARRCIELLCPYGVQVFARDRKWMEQKKMHAILSSARGSCEPPVFLQLDYCGTNINEKPTILIGKGTTFNCGGLCLKDCEGMSEFRADMSGAAVVVAVFRAVAAMRLPINMHGIIPLFENMISGMAMKPGDVVVAQNGKVMRDEHTDNYSHIAVTDAISYCQVLKPNLIMNIATMSEGIKASLGGGPSAVFSTSDAIWDQLAFAGSLTGDRMWRMPLFKDYRHLVTDYLNCDVNNVGKGIGGGACLGAAFLMEFAPPKIDFAYIDSTGTGMLANGFIPFLTGGVMSGRPTRTIIQFMCHRAYACDKEDINKPDPESCLDEHDRPPKKHHQKKKAHKELEKTYCKD